jgi:hypothetical protein
MHQLGRIEQAVSEWKFTLKYTYVSNYLSCQTVHWYINIHGYGNTEKL